MKSKFVFFVIFCLILVSVTACSSSTAQVEENTPTPPPPTETSLPPTETNTLEPSTAPVHGVLELADGFRPNPLINLIHFGGSLDLISHIENESCVGFVESGPDLGIDWSGGGFLRFFFLSNDSANTTLAIQDPDGNWHCGDDSFDTLNPTVDFEGAPAGRFTIWVGGESAGETDLGHLYITQVKEIDPTDLDFSNAILDVKFQPDAPPRTAEITLAEGFAPDPMVIELLAGGQVDHNRASEFPTVSFEIGVWGFTHAEPDVRINWQGSGYLRIFFVADHGENTLLHINAPNLIDNLNDGREYDGVIYEDPLLEFNTTFNGSYNIWVNSFSPSVLVPGKLYITTSTELHPGNLGD